MWTKSNNYIIQGNAKNAEMDLFHLIIAPSYACNLRCKHCYLPHHNPNFMSYTLVEKIMDDWTEIIRSERGKFGGIFHLKGGEPFIMPYFDSILEKIATEKLLRLMITTNGTVLNYKYFNLLEKCLESLDGNVIVNLSLDGATDATHDFIRGKGRFNKSISFLSELRQRDIPVHINFVINKKNINEAEEIINLGRRYSVNQVNFLPFVAKGYGEGFNKYKITPIEIYEAIENIYSGNENIRKLLIGTLPQILRLENKVGCSTKECVLGYKGLYYITPNGDVFSCPNLMQKEFSLGNLNEIRLKEINDHLINELYNKIKNNSSFNDYSCKGAVEFYKRTQQDDMVSANLKFNEKMNLLSPNSEKRELAFCFSRNI